MRIFPYGASHKTCFDVISQVHICIEVMFSVGIQLNCDSSQENSAVVIFFKKIAAVFLLPAATEVKTQAIKVMN